MQITNYILILLLLWEMQFPVNAETTKKTSGVDSKNEQSLRYFQKNLKNSNAKIVLPFIYDYASEFSEDLAAVCFGEIKSSSVDPAKPAWRTGYIDKNGKVIIPPYYDIAEPFKDGMALVKIADSNNVIEIFIDKQGNEIFRTTYETIKDKSTGKGTGAYIYVGGFSDGLRMVYEYDGSLYKFGYVNKKGELVIPYQYQYTQNFSEGLAIIGKKVSTEENSKVLYGFMDKNQKLVIDYKYEGLGDFHYGVAPFVVGASFFAGYTIGGRYGLINPKGEIIAPANFLNVPAFSEGLAGVCVGESLNVGKSRCGVIDTKGRFIIAPIFETVDVSREADLTILKYSEGMAKYSEKVAGKTKFGFIDRNGTKVIKAQFDYLSEFSEGLAPFTVKTESGEKVGYLNKNGKIAIDAIFDDARPFHQSLAPVRVGDKWGYIALGNNSQKDFSSSDIKSLVNTDLSNSSRMSSGSLSDADLNAINDSVRSAITASLNKTPGSDPVFSTDKDLVKYQKWFSYVADKIVEKYPDRRSREDFIKIVWYEARRAGLDANLVLSLIETTSNFRKFIITASGSTGYMGVNPQWALKAVNDDYKKKTVLFDTQVNLRFGCSILRLLLDREQGDLTLALTEYKELNRIQLDTIPAASVNFAGLVLSNRMHWVK